MDRWATAERRELGATVEPAGKRVNGDPCLPSVHSTKVAKFARGPSSDDGALHAMFKLAS